MTDATQRNRRATSAIVRLLLIGGTVAAVLGVASLTVGRFRGMAGLLLLIGGVGATTIGLLLELLTEIANHLAVIRTQLKSLELLTNVADHLAAIRTQMGKGVLGLLG